MDEPKITNFALLIRHTEHPDGTSEMSVRAENEGIPDAEVILTVEGWIERVRKRFMKQRMGGLRFDTDDR